MGIATIIGKSAGFVGKTINGAKKEYNKVINEVLPEIRDSVIANYRKEMEMPALIGGPVAPKTQPVVKEESHVNVRYSNGVPKVDINDPKLDKLIEFRAYALSDAMSRAKLLNIEWYMIEKKVTKYIDAKLEFVTKDSQYQDYRHLGGMAVIETIERRK